MGVRYLETYLERESRNSCYDVDIAKIVEEYRRRTGLKPVIVVDGMSCLRPLYGKLSWLNGGQFKEFYQVIQKFIRNFTELGCELVVYFDGPVQNIKLSTWKKRRIQSGNDLSLLFNNLDRGTGACEKMHHSSFLPNGLGSIFFYLLSENSNCRIFKALKECDEEIAEYALKNNCFAILAQDSDYVIYRSARYYLSVKNLDLDKMTTLCYDGFNLSDELGIRCECLPLLASLLGNDIIDYETVKPFHNVLKRKSRYYNYVLVVAEYIRHLRYTDLSKIAFDVVGRSSCAEMAALLKKSMSSYDLQSASRVVEKPLTDHCDSWQQILKLGKEKFIYSFYTAPLYDIIFYNRFFSSACLEDYRPENIILPVGEIIKELRRFIYGILLYEKPSYGNKPNCVSELVMTGFNSMDAFVEVEPKYLEKVKHPGLIALWTSTEKCINDIRWEILAEVFKLKPSTISHLPPSFLAATLAARYVKLQFPGIAEWEINAWTACTVCIGCYTAEVLATLPKDPLTYRQIWLYTALTRTAVTVNNLMFYIGGPIPLEFSLPYNFTDGKLFHEKYRLSKKNTPNEVLCEFEVENLEMFNLLKSVIIN